jgi:hydrogenase expression/formation protein HypE
VGASSAHVDDLVLVTKGVALEGTAILAYDFTDVALRLGLSEQDVAEARQLMAEVSVVPEAVALAVRGATAMHDVTRGGILETLLEIAYRSQVGIEIDGARLPVRPVVSRFAEAFQFDPLRMISSGTLVATVPPKRAADVRSALEEMGMPFAFAGLVTPGSGARVLREGRVERYTGIHCEEDELARLWTLYPRGE